MNNINIDTFKADKDRVNIISVRSIFSMNKIFQNIDYGRTILEIVKEIQSDESMWENINVYINDTYIEQDIWYKVKPKEGTVVRIFATPTGGGEEGSQKDIIRLVAIIAIVIIAPSAAPYIVSALGVSTAVATALFVVAATALVHKLIPIVEPKLSELTPDDAASPSQFLQGARNRLNPFGVVPRVFGKHRMAPPFAALPYTEVRGDDQYLRLLFLWGTGPLDLSDFKIGETDLFDDNGVSNFGEDLEIEHLEGGEAVITFMGSNISVGFAIIYTSNSYKDDMAVRFRSNDTLPNPLVTDQIYYVINATSGRFEITKIKGSSTDRIVFIDGGTGTHTAYPTLALYPQDIFEEALSINLLQVDDWTSRTTQPNTTEISVDITFPSGLVRVDDEGSRLNRTVSIQLQYAKAGTSPLVWQIDDAGYTRPQTDFQIPRPQTAIILVSSDPVQGDVYRRHSLGYNSIIAIHRNTGEFKWLRGDTQSEFGNFTLNPTRKLPSIPTDYITLVRFSTSFTNGVHNITDIRPAQPPFSSSSPSDFLGSALGSDGIRIASGTINKLVRIFTDRRGIAIRKTIRFPVPEIGQYVVRIRRVTADTDNIQIADDSHWTVIRSIQDAFPVEKRGVALTALVVKATDQLSGVIDTFTGLAQAIILDYDNTLSPPEWVERITTNPASAYRRALQGIENPKPLSDSEISLTDIEAWHIACQAAPFEFNMVRDFPSSVYELLKDIALSGRATPTIKDGKWSIVRDILQTVPIQHFTPRNSSNFSGSKSFLDIPHGLRIRFPNREKNYTQDELIVYDDGFDVENATLLESVELPGITSPGIIWREGRYHIFTVRLRPEKYTFDTDIEYIVATRGDLIRLTHDVIAVGLAYGRVKAIADDGSSPPNAISVTVDEELSMDSGGSYGIRFRLSDGTSLVKNVDTVPGGGVTVLTFTTPFLLSLAPAIGDLYMFGVQDLESIEAIIQEVIPKNNLSASVTCVDAAPAVHTAGVIPQDFVPGDIDIGTDIITLTAHPFKNDDEVSFKTDTSPGALPDPLLETTGGSPDILQRYFVISITTNSLQVSLTKNGTAINLTNTGIGVFTITRLVPTFTSNITGLPSVTSPVIRNVRSDETVLLRTVDGSLLVRILIEIEKPSSFLVAIVGVQARYRVNDPDGEIFFWELTPVQDLSQGYIEILPVEELEIYDYQCRFVNNDNTKGPWSDIAQHTVIGKSSLPSNVSGFAAQQNGDVVTFQWNQVDDRDLQGYEIRFGLVGVAWDDASVLTQVTRGTRVTTASIPPGTWDCLIKAVDTSNNFSLSETRIDIIVVSIEATLSILNEWPVWSGTKINYVRNPRTGNINPESQVGAGDSGVEFEIFDNYVYLPFAESSYESKERDISFDDQVRIWIETVTNIPIAAKQTGFNLFSQELDYRLESESFDGYEIWTIGQVTARYFKLKLVVNTSENELRITKFQLSIDLLEHTETVDLTIPVGGLEVIFGKSYTKLPIQLVIDNIVAAGSPLVVGIATINGLVLTGFRVWILNSSGDDIGGTADYTSRGE